MFKGSHRGRAPSNITPALPKSINMDIWVVGTSNQNFQKNKVVAGWTPFIGIGLFWTLHSICLNIWLVTWHFCMEVMRFQSYCFQMKNRTPVFWKMFSFSRKFVSKLKYWKCSKFPLIATLKHADLSNEGLFWKPLVLFFRWIYVCWL